MKNNKGFTIVELLATVVIILLLGLIVTPNVVDIINENRNKGYLEIERRLEEAASKYIVNEYIDSSVESVIITKEDLINTGYIKEIYDLKDKSVCDASIYAYNLNSMAEFNPILSCSSYETKGRNAVWYIKDLYADETTRTENGLTNPKVTYEGKEYDTGIRYSGNLEKVQNQVYFNCEDKDSNNVKYGEKDYDYANSCEVWRIIGVFDVDNGSGKQEKSVKLINIASTFRASWDSSANDVNNGYGINQWGSSTYSDGTPYEGSDLMRLLNGFYIGKSDDCTYCTGTGQAICQEVCTAESLKSAKMKVLTESAKRLINNAVWDIYGVKSSDDEAIINFASIVYLEEKGISAINTGKNLCVGTGDLYGYCNDSVERTTSWTGLVGLMSASDIIYAGGWLYNQSETTLYPWSISPCANSFVANVANNAYDDNVHNADVYNQDGVFASLYLKSNVKIKGGNGADEPYILGI